jgi:transcriptional regulator with XRE-family HTH domain
MPLQTTPTAIRRYIAFELRRLRESTGMSQKAAAPLVDTSQTRLSHFESGETLPKLPEVDALLNAYKTPELIELVKELIIQVRNAPQDAPQLIELDSEMRLPEGFDMYLGLEQGASRILTYDAMTVKGMLQCRPYAEALLRGHDAALPDAEVARRVDLRMRRQQVLDRTESPVELVAVVDESVLHRQIGGPKVLAEQLEFLLTVASKSNVSLRVLPYAAGVHPALHGPFTLLSFPIERDPGVVYLEDRLGGRYRDNPTDIDEYRSVAERLLELALDDKASLPVIKKAREEIAP